MALDLDSTTTQAVSAGEYAFRLNFVGQWQYDSQAARIEIHHREEVLWRNEQILFDLGLCDVDYESDPSRWRSPLVLSADSRFALLRLLSDKPWSGWRALLFLDLDSRSFAVTRDRPFPRSVIVVSDNSDHQVVSLHHYMDDQVGRAPEQDEDHLSFDSSDFVPMDVFRDAGSAENLRALTK